VDTSREQPLNANYRYWSELETVGTQLQLVLFTGEVVLKEEELPQGEEKAA